MDVVNGSTDVTTYFVLRDSTTHAPKTDVTIADIDLYYLEQGAAMAAKVDATALAAADSAHGDNQAFHCGHGLYRVDWPDGAFDGGVGKIVELIVVCIGVDTTFLEVELKDPWQTGDSYAIVNGDHGLVSIQDAIDSLLADVGDASASTLGSLYAILGNAAASIDSRTASGTPGANNGVPTTNGTKINQTVDADMKKINGHTLGGDGSTTPFGPVD